MAKKSAALASLRPSDFVKAGLPNDVDVEIVSASVMMFTYPGTDTESLSVELEMKNLEDGNTMTQNLSAGGGFTPNDDGTGFVPTGSRQSLSMDSNFAMWVASCVDEGFPEDKIENDVTVFNGLVFHLIRKAPPKGRGVGEDKQVVLCDKIIKLPWEKGTGKAGKAGAGTGKTASAPATKGSAGKKASSNGDDPEDRAKSVLAELLAENGNSVPFDKLRNLTFKKLKAEPEIRNKVLELVADKDWVEAAVEGIEGAEFDGETLSIAE